MILITSSAVKGKILAILIFTKSVEYFRLNLLWFVLSALVNDVINSKETNLV